MTGIDYASLTLLGLIAVLIIFNSNLVDYLVFARRAGLPGCLLSYIPAFFAEEILARSILIRFDHATWITHVEYHWMSLLHKLSYGLSDPRMSFVPKDHGHVRITCRRGVYWITKTLPEEYHALVIRVRIYPSRWPFAAHQQPHATH
jgi:hypothetical protein